VGRVKSVDARGFETLAALAPQPPCT